MAIDRPAFGALLRRLRLDAGLSQEALAERARISVQAVSALERGARSAPQTQTLALLANAFGLDGDERARFEAAAAASAKARVRRAPIAPAPPPFPAIPTSFVGREAERTEVARLLQPGRCLTIWGSGGIGKTRLVLETVRTVYERFPDGVWFVDLVPLSQSDDVARAAATELGVREEADRSLIDSLEEMLAEKRGLLVLDNAEHVLDGCARLVERLLAGAPSLAIACTSREPMRVNAEVVYALDSLPVPALSDADLTGAPAVRLFLDRAENAGVRIEPAPDELRAIATIAHRLDAIPLALELAAARMPLMTAAEIARALDERFRLLAHGSRSASARHQTLVGTLDWSYTLLSQTERIVFRRLAVWPGSWTLDDAAAVAGGGEVDRWDVVGAVGTLRDRSLVVSVSRDEAQRRFRLLQTTGAYALQHLSASGELAERERLFAHRVAELAGLAGEWWRRSDAPFEGLEIDAVRAALRWAITLGNDPALGAAIAGQAAMLWDVRAMQLEGLRWIADVLAALDESTHPNATLLARIGQARLFRRLGLARDTFDSARIAAALAERAGDAKQRAIALSLMAAPAALLGRHDEGSRLLDEAGALFKRLDDAPGRLAVLWEQAFVAMHAGDYAGGRDRFERLLVAWRSRGMHKLAVQAAINLAEAEFLLGDTDTAIARGVDALGAARDIDAPLLVGAMLQNVAAYLLDAGRVDEAAAYARESLEMMVAYGYAVHADYALGHLADVLSRRGRARDAAILVGFVDRDLADAGATREGAELRGYESVMTLLRRTLDAPKLAAALAEGAALDPDEAVQFALDVSSK